MLLAVVDTPVCERRRATVRTGEVARRVDASEKHLADPKNTNLS